MPFRGEIDNRVNGSTDRLVCVAEKIGDAGLYPTSIASVGKIRLSHLVFSEKILTQSLGKTERCLMIGMPYQITLKTVGEIA